MRTFFIISLNFTLFYFMACVSAADHSQKSSEYLAFGSFGGFAGSYTEYTLYADGRMSKKDRLKGPSEILSGIDKKVAAQCIDLVRQLKSETSIHDAGNLSYFIRLHTKKGEVHEFLWGGTNEEVPEKLKKLYANLTALSRNKNPIM